ncbi:nitronate monooxygenase [Actinomadura barringtoniae]|uniref:Propionate 3-nitronate monooxygenase n=2 Tax=Actinomadura barringtoniae TaxID=1427535 RepID=A0A939PIN6_9ACTN|nr:nitronate monooxygenase [Actinomadura barringtoniae]
MLASRIVQAPMAGGGSRPALVAAVAEAGALGFLAAGYKTAAQVRAEINQTRAATSRPFGLNLFMPATEPVDEVTLAAYRDRMIPEAKRLGVAVGATKDRSDDWDAKIADLMNDPPAVISFTFGCPEDQIIRAFQQRGAIVVVTVTSVEEARTAAAADALCVQGDEAGAHRGTFSNEDWGAVALRALVPAVRAITEQPILAAGGLMNGEAIAAILDLGADAGQLGTAFVRCPESGASDVHKNALADPRFTATAVTRAFSGRPARGLVNRFQAEHSPYAPAAYPEIHYMTSPLRKAAAAQGDAESVNLWAGTSWRLATDAPAAEIVERLKSELAASARR